MKILIHREKREVVDDKERTVSKEKRYFVDELSKDFPTFYGMIKKADLQKSGVVIKTDKDQEFIIFDASFIDVHKNLKKFAQTIPLKDIGAIIAETGINKDSVVVEGGVGSAALAIALANVAKQVISYEIRDDCIKTAEENIKQTSTKNIVLKKASLYEGIDEKNVDVVCFDLPEPWHAVKYATKALKVGGFLVNYSIQLSQVQKFVEEVHKQDELYYVKTVELIERPWAIDNKRLRPNNSGIGHSGFLTFVRKIKS
ncbi:hypothetical protein COV18_01260 [Candidatus Woesearchaeota archaeon CG10_big_fil_rev_8_21_14_0_10_37_12]|nr:MAG: hypothetical protein COV18_01260 [Candidatus Woesearchaeota archaeon CG10_big_fil_rev_8_21_14_0_10_37_12]